MVDDHALLTEAIKEAEMGLAEGGLPIGAVLADRSQDTLEAAIVSRGRNLRVQTGDQTAHAEMMSFRNAGRRRDWPKLTLYSTLSPCIMCTGASLLFRIPRVVIGENVNFRGAEELFHEAGVELVNLENERCITLMRDFIAQHPDLWNEDIGI